MALPTIVAVTGAVVAVAKIVPKIVPIFQRLGGVISSIDKQHTEVVKYEGKIEEFDEEMTIRYAVCTVKAFPKYITEMCRINKIKPGLRDELINSKHCKEFNFVFHKFTMVSGDGNPRIGRFASIKDKDNNINFAVWIYKCNFKLKANKIIHRKKKKLWICEWGKTEIIEHEPQNLSIEEISTINSYFMNKAIDKFYQQAPKALLPDAEENQHKKLQIKGIQNKVNKQQTKPSTTCDNAKDNNSYLSDLSDLSSSDLSSSDLSSSDLSSSD
eukprot:4894_1